MSSQVVKVFLLICLLQLSERLVFSGTIPPVTSLETKLPGGETKAPGSGEPFAVTGTTPTPSGKEETGNPETKPPGGKTEGPDSLIITEAPQTKLPGGETKASGTVESLLVTGTTPGGKEETGNPETKSPGGKTEGPDSLVMTEAPVTKSPEGKTKASGTEKILPVTGTTPTPPANELSGKPKTKSPGGNTEAPGTAGPETAAPVTKPK